MITALLADDADAPDEAVPAAAWAKRTPGQKEIRENRRLMLKYTDQVFDISLFKYYPNIWYEN